MGTQRPGGTITSKDVRGEWNQQDTMRELEQREQASGDKAKAQELLNSVPTGTLTEMQLKVDAAYRGSVYPPNAPEFFATQALGLSANAGKVSNVIGKITKDGFDQPAGDEELAKALLSASAMSIVHAMLIINEMGYSVEDVLNGVL